VYKLEGDSSVLIVSLSEFAGLEILVLTIQTFGPASFRLPQIHRQISAGRLSSRLNVGPSRLWLLDSVQQQFFGAIISKI
jgi:hypothetical protein